MKLTGMLWDEDTRVKVDVLVERTDEDEIAVFADGEDDASATLYLSAEMAVRMATMLGIAAHAHEIQAHEAANIAARSEP